MKKIEVILIKLVIIQFIFLLFFQIAFHRNDSFLELKKLAEYEGVYLDNYSLFMDVFQNNNK
ncbi:MAG: DUF5359 family protein [Bacillus sp. (in: firmicutes)]